MAFAPVEEEKSCIIADQSGSGKTLAYLAPVVQRLRQEEVDGVSKSSSQSPNWLYESQLQSWLLRSAVFDREHKA
ncbi:P-loop containing nucleoside triphosphate hydrolase [Parasponia andersonii]|uniref:P-loop containing nucleoside triphosphate hydrolase n=1 Tax=Parasponia andersonii TaxID=3476 RepID=A0A2P5DZY3_PARAD|nr:P-loop containing nucleoside triphosphate hydrolase [Parasponia andersonii]